jgi:phosphoenolpyruvate carboxykinase (GTP)
VPDGIDTTGLDMSPELLAELLKVDNEAWRGEIPLIEEHFAFIGEHLPTELRDELNNLQKRLAN